MAPLEPQKEVPVSKDVLSNDNYGEIEYQARHGGKPAAEAKDNAHKGLIAAPSIADPQGTCDECHEESPPTAAKSLQVALAPLANILEKRASPHNILRKTWQTANGNHCHGNWKRYLFESNLKDYEITTNRAVVVLDSRVSAPIAGVRRLEIDTIQVKTGWTVDHQWLNGTWLPRDWPSWASVRKRPLKNVTKNSRRGVCT